MKKLFFILLLPLILGSQCNKEDECHKNIEFYNNDTKDIYVLAYFDTTFYQHYALPGEKVLAKNKSDNAISFMDCIEYRIATEEPQCLGIIVSDAKLVDDSTWEYVSSNKVCLKQ
jgi:hypothetical protein